MPDRLLVIQTETLDNEAHDWLGQRCELIACSSDDEPRFSGLLRRARGLVIRTYTTVGPALLERAPALRVVARAGVGLDNIDLPACRARGITVVSTPAANTRAVVEYVVALILDALRPRVYVDAAIDTAVWKQLRQDLIAPRQLSDLTLGVYGLGRVGGGIARVGASLDMRVLYHDLLDFPASRRFGAAPVPREQLLAQSDILSVHVDSRPSNRHLIDAAALALCKPGVLLINTSRGFVIDPRALAAFMNAHPDAAAALDVHDPEPFGPDYPLLGLPNVRLSPHLAAATATAHRNMSWVVKDLWRVLCGEAPEFPAW